MQPMRRELVKTHRHLVRLHMRWSVGKVAKYVRSSDRFAMRVGAKAANEVAGQVWMGSGHNCNKTLEPSVREHITTQW
jgi:hypothetical protein